MGRPDPPGDARRRAYALLAMARPGFLLGVLPLYAVGVAAAIHGGHPLRWLPAGLGLGTVWAVQAMTHFTNEYWDVEVDTGAATARAVTGGSGVLVERLVPRRTAAVAAVGVLGIALAFTVASATAGGVVFLLVVGAGIVGGWAYSAPPVRLAGRGVGEVTVAGITGVLVPTVGYVLQAGTVDIALLRPCVPLVLLAFATAVSTAIPDVDADRAGGKRTLAVRLGRHRAIVLDAGVLAAGWIGAGAALVPIAPVPGGLVVAALLGPIGVFAAAAPGAARGDGDADVRVALAGISALGIASVGTVGVLLLG